MAWRAMSENVSYLILEYVIDDLFEIVFTIGQGSGRTVKGWYDSSGGRRAGQ